MKVIIGALHDKLGARGGHDRKKPVGIYNFKRFEQGGLKPKELQNAQRHHATHTRLEDCGERRRLLFNAPPLRHSCKTTIIQRPDTQGHRQQVEESKIARKRYKNLQ